jgi:hypothetical protein
LLLVRWNQKPGIGHIAVTLAELGKKSFFLFMFWVEFRIFGKKLLSRHDWTFQY